MPQFRTPSQSEYQNSEPRDEEDYEYCRGTRSGAPSPDGTASPVSEDELDLLLPATPTKVASLSSSEGQQSTFWSNPLRKRRSSSRTGRSRRRSKLQHRRRNTPPVNPMKPMNPIMRTFLDRGGEQERSRRASTIPQSLPYRMPHNSLEDLTPSTMKTPQPAPPSQSDWNTLFPAIADQVSSSKVYHITAAYRSRSVGDTAHYSKKRIDTFGIWNSLAAAQEAAERCSQLPSFQKCVVVFKMRLLSDGTVESDQDQPISTVPPRLSDDGSRNVVTIEIVEYSSYSEGMVPKRRAKSETGEH